MIDRLVPEIESRTCFLVLLPFLNAPSPPLAATFSIFTNVSALHALVHETTEETFERISQKDASGCILLRLAARRRKAVCGTDLFVQGTT
jgi:hypothetical protein